MGKHSHEWEDTGQKVNGHIIQQKIRYKRNSSADYGGQHHTRDKKLQQFRCKHCDREYEKRFKFAEAAPECEMPLNE